jgi:hypothetical protein
MQGYLYQCKYALIAAVQKLRTSGTVTVNIECLDDIDFPEVASPAELLQVKFHQSKLASITDASPEIWGTLRVWIDNFNSGRIPSDARLFLVTTAVANLGSIARALSAGDDRDVDAAVAGMDLIVASSVSDANEKAYELYKALEKSQRYDLAQRIVVLDSQGGFAELDDQLIAEVRLALPSRAHLVAQRLEEWWYARCVKHLLETGPILGEELVAQIEDIADSLRDDRLPVDAIFDEPEPDSYNGRDFIRQLHLAGITGDAVLQAVKDYFRAFTQRSRWEREDLLTVGELGHYEKQLAEEWEIRFRHMVEDLGDDGADAAKVDAARQLYRWVEAEARFAIRPRCTDGFLTRGSYQMLSDDRRVGWHPDFEARLATILESQAAE